jgi:hypothetical protein
MFILVFTHEAEDTGKHKHLEWLPTVDCGLLDVRLQQTALEMYPFAMLQLPLTFAQLDDLLHFAYIEGVCTEEAKELHSAKDFIPIVQMWIALHLIEVFNKSHINLRQPLHASHQPLAQYVNCLRFLLYGHFNLQFSMVNLI